MNALTKLGRFYWVIFLIRLHRGHDRGLPFIAILESILLTSRLLNIKEKGEAEETSNETVAEFNFQAMRKSAAMRLFLSHLNR